MAAGAALVPSLDGFASASRGNLELGQAATIVQAGVQTAWEIDVFGRLRGVSAAAAAQVLAALMELTLAGQADLLSGGMVVVGED